MNEGPDAVVVTLTSSAPVDDARCGGHLATIVRRVVAAAVAERLGVRVDDVVLDGDRGPAVDRLLDGGVPALFGNTLHPRAIDVRRRMLDHLGIIPIDRLDAATVAELQRLRLTPTDWYLIVTTAASRGEIDPDLAAFASGPGEAANRLADLTDAIVADPSACTPAP